MTGGTGHLGRDLVARLKGSYRVRVLARSPGSDPDVEWVRGDLATGEASPMQWPGARRLSTPRRFRRAACRGYFVPKDLWSSPADVDREGTARLLDCRRGRRRTRHLRVDRRYRQNLDSPTYGASWRLKSWLIEPDSVVDRPRDSSSTGCRTACSAGWRGSPSCRCQKTFR